MCKDSLEKRRHKGCQYYYYANYIFDNLKQNGDGALVAFEKKEKKKNPKKTNRIEDHQPPVPKDVNSK